MKESIKEVRSRLMHPAVIWVCGGGVNCAVRTLVDFPQPRLAYLKHGGMGLKK